MGVIVRLFISAFLLGNCLPAFAEVQRFTISQGYSRLPAVKAYVDIVDANEQPAAGLTPANFSVELGTTSAQATSLNSFKDTGEGVAYAFLVDISKSISPADFGQMQAAIAKWIDGLRPVDRAAIYTFGDGYQMVVDFTANKQQLTAATLNLAVHDGSTHLYQALRGAMEIEHRGDSQLPMRRVLVMLSDGHDEGSAVTEEDVVHQLQSSHIPIYAIGYGPTPGHGKQPYLDVLRRFAELSGGIYEKPAGHNIDEPFTAIQNAILRVFVLDSSCPKCVADGRPYPLRITLAQADKKVSSSLEVIPIAAPNSSSSSGGDGGGGSSSQSFIKSLLRSVSIRWLRMVPVWIYPSVALLISVAGGLLIALKKKEKPVPAVAPTVPVAVPTTLPPSKPVTVKGIPMQLAIVSGKERGRVIKFQLEKTIVIGRAANCDVVLNDPRISSRHCEMTLSNRAVLIYDLDSTNSTYVKGVPILGRHKLEDEDSLLLGETELRLRFDEDEVRGR